MDFIIMNGNLHRTHVITLFYQYSVLRAIQLPVMQFALFPFAFVSNINLFPNTVTDKISVVSSKKTNKQKKQNKTKEEKKNNKKQPSWNSVRPGHYIRSFTVFQVFRFLLKKCGLAGLLKLGCFTNCKYLLGNFSYVYITVLSCVAQK